MFLFLPGLCIFKTQRLIIIVISELWCFQKVKKEWHHGVAFTHMGYNKTLSSENKYMVQESEDEKFLSYREISLNSQILNSHFYISINAGRENEFKKCWLRCFFKNP